MSRPIFFGFWALISMIAAEGAAASAADFYLTGHPIAASVAAVWVVTMLIVFQDCVKGGK